MHFTRLKGTNGLACAICHQAAEPERNRDLYDMKVRVTDGKSAESELTLAVHLGCVKLRVDEAYRGASL